jgi:hypothetical protein
MGEIRDELEIIRGGFSASSPPEAAPAGVLQNGIPVQFSDEQIASLSTAFSRDATGSSSMTQQMRSLIMSQSIGHIGRKNEPPADAGVAADAGSVRE